MNPRHARLGGEDPELALDAEPFPDDVGDLVDDLGEVSPRLPLDQDRGGEEPDVEGVHAFRHPDEGLAQRHPQVLLLEHLPELGTDRVGHLLGDELYGAGERVPGPKGSGEHFQRIREVVHEPLDA